jgi:hypothetical protein
VKTEFQEMLIQRISRADPERVFVVVRAAEAGCDRGWAVAFDMSGTRNGIDVEQSDAADNIALMVGHAHTDIANGSYGLAQAYGYDDDVVVLQSNAYAVGAPLIWSSAKSCFIESSASAPDGESVHAQVVAASTLATSATTVTNRLACFVRFL